MRGNGAVLETIPNVTGPSAQFHLACHPEEQARRDLQFGSTADPSRRAQLVRSVALLGMTKSVMVSDKTPEWTFHVAPRYTVNSMSFVKSLSPVCHECS